MDDAERDARNARAIGCFARVRNALMGFGILMLGLLIPAWRLSVGPDEVRHPGPWPWVAAVACWVVGPLLLWQAFRRSPPMR